MALGDFKRTSRDDKTISIAQPNEALRNPLSRKEEEVCQKISLISDLILVIT
jgi:hypothetical protein